MVEGEGGGSQNPSQPLGIFFLVGRKRGGGGRIILQKFQCISNIFLASKYPNVIAVHAHILQLY